MDQPKLPPRSLKGMASLLTPFTPGNTIHGGGTKFRHSKPVKGVWNLCALDCGGSS